MAEAVTLTPVEELHGGVWAKRDDLFTVAGVSGGKARSCYYLATRDPSTKGLVTAGSRASPQVNIVAHIAAHLGLPCRVHTPTGALSPKSYKPATWAQRLCNTRRDTTQSLWRVRERTRKPVGG